MYYVCEGQHVGHVGEDVVRIVYCDCVGPIAVCMEGTCTYDIVFVGVV